MNTSALLQVLRLMVLAGLLSTPWSGPAWADALRVGQPAPALTLHTLNGDAISTLDLRGKIVILTFWATWCDPCREELPVLSSYVHRHAANGLEALGFSLDGQEDLATVRKVASSLNFPSGLLGSPWAGGYGRVWHIPVSFVIDRDGRLVYNGWQDKDPVWTEAKLEQVVGPLLR